MDNIIDIELTGRSTRRDQKLWQYDYGQVLRIAGKEFPKVTEVQFSLQQSGGHTLDRIGTSNNGLLTVQIPNELLQNKGTTSDYTIYAFVYLSGDGYGNTKYMIQLPVESRPEPTDPSEDPTIDPSIFKDAINAVNASAERAETAEKSAKESADKAKEYAESAGKSKEDVEKARDNAISAIGIEKESALRGIEIKTVESLQKIQSQTEESQNSINQSISDATEKKKELDGAISNATDAKGNLDKAVQSAGDAKTELDTSIGKVGEAKTSLDSSIRSAGEKQLALDATVEQANAVDASLKEQIGSAEQIQANVEQIGKNTQAISSLNEDLGNVVKITETKSTNKLNFIDVEEQEKNGITMSYQDNVLSLNGTAPSTTEFAIPLAENLSDGIYKFYYELLEGDFNQNILYKYQSNAYAQFTKNTTTVKDISINGQTRSKIALTKDQIFKNCKFHIWAELSSEATGMFSIPGTTQKDISLNEDLEIPQVKENKSNINDIQEILKTKQEYEIIDGKMVLKNGEIKSDTNSACINLKLEAGDTIVFKAYGGTAYAIMSESTPDFGKIINVITVGTSNDEMIYKYTANQDIYLVLSCRSNKEYSIEKILYLEKLKSALLDILNTKENYRYLLKVFEGKKGLCIGDSLTYGVVNGASSGAINTTKNYPYWFSKMTNLAVDVDGHPGWTASQMYERVKSNNYEEYGFVLLFLGTNGGLTTGEQISAYKQIIEKFINDNNSIKIFLITPFTVNNYSKQDTVNQIYAIGKEKEIAVIDANIAPFKYTVIDGKIHEYDITHLSEMGYFLLANVIVNGMGKGIYDYLEKYNEC